MYEDAYGQIIKGLTNNITENIFLSRIIEVECVWKAIVI